MVAEHERLAQEGVKLVELRLDFLRREPDLNRIIPHRPTATVLTVRRQQDGGLWRDSEEKRLMLLRTAIATEPEFIDLEIDVAEKIPLFGKTRRIISYHNLETMPENLERLYLTMLAKNPYFIKIAVTPQSLSEMYLFLNFIRRKNEEAKQLGENGIRVIGICMGEMGKAARILSKRFSMPYTYATFSEDRIIAPGLIVYKDLLDLYHYDYIDQETAVYGIIGNPLGHSMSPLVHNRAFIEQKINAVYIPLQIEESDVEDLIRLAPELGLQGISVTIPHKTTIISQLTKADQAVEKIGACNTVVFRQGERIGYNTDYIASIGSIETALDGSILDEDSVLRNQTALVLGAGGAGKALAYGLVQRGAMVTVTDINPTQAMELARHFGIDYIRWEHRETLQPNILLNCTSVGMYPKVDEMPYSKSALRSSMLVFDAVYNPEHTLLIRTAKEKGCKVVTGIEMFVGQACYQFKLFTGQHTSPSKMRIRLKEAIARMNWA
ncbi:MAG: shikimate dehydrogenase [Planctomycetaceae bacterium]|nr:shikimate dehydrogenase [Planctomycetaceae bacterium]